MSLRKKMVIGAAVVAVIGLALFIWYFLSAHEQEWARRDAAKQTVLSKTVITSVYEVETFLLEKPYVIVHGADENGRQAIAWVDGDQVATQYADQGVTEQDVRAKVMAENADNRIMRVMPGILDDQYVWEVFYERKVDGTKRFFYQYYLFETGELADSWRLLQR